MAICPLLAHFKKQKWPREKPVFMRVCGFPAHFPTYFSYLIVIKNIKNINNWRKKVGI